MKPTPVHLIPATFWEKVDRRGPDECWPWLAGKQQDGYGVFRSKPAHRWSYTLTYGEIAPGLQVDHACHNRGCVNPAHLRQLSRVQNQHNRKGANRNSSTGVLGVHPYGSGYIVRIGYAGARYADGPFATIEEATVAASSLRSSLVA